ncbi:MAG: type I DNA topoisomerase [Thermodesulfovibrionales bacterium]
MKSKKPGSNNLVIVESPAKARTLHKILGKDFIIKASIGHIKDLPENDIGVDEENDFKPTYVVIPGKEKIIKELKKASKEADKIFLAPDPDREGEAIAWHIASEIADPESLNGRIYRIIFNEITERAVKEAIKNPGKIDLRKVDAQQARRILDRLVGYKLSPLLWKKVRRGLSAGRVQSVAVKLIVDRDREIKAFQPEEYWSISAEFEGSKLPTFWARLHAIIPPLKPKDAEESKFLIPTGETALKIVDELKDKEFVLKKIEHKRRRRMPYPPFITSTLQQEAARKLRFPAKKTMMIAQQLYEGVELAEEGSVGLITYMRTDSFRVAPEAQQEARNFIVKTYGKDYVPEKPPVYKSKPSAQEAHEAIRPTYLNKTPEDIKPFLSKDQYALYTLIWNRFIASQMAPSQLDQTTFIIMNRKPSVDSQFTEYEFRASGTVLRFDGFMRLYTESKDDAEEDEGLTLPSLKEGETLKLINLQPKQHLTQPPPPYTEATLIKALEEKGIGRPSTYATILSTIQERKYVQKTNGKFSPTDLGIVVNDFLVERFPELIDVNFTAKMEDELDRIEDGKMEWVKLVKDFYNPFSKELAKVERTKGKIKPEDIPTDEICEKCGLAMVIRWGRHGRFLACSGFPKCRNTRPLPGKDTEFKEQSGNNIQITEEKCEKCGSAMVIRTGKYGKFLSCTRYPDCKNRRPISTGIKCPLDAGDIVERGTKKGKPFWSCSNYPKCHFVLWDKPIQVKCPKCGIDFLIEKADKTGKIIHYCYDKSCGYKVEIKEEASAPVT